jgi:hypothetical protein
MKAVIYAEVGKSGDSENDESDRRAFGVVRSDEPGTPSQPERFRAWRLAEKDPLFEDKSTTTCNTRCQCCKRVTRGLRMRREEWG